MPPWATRLRRSPSTTCRVSDATSNTFIELQPGVSAGGDVAGAVNDQSYFSLDGGNNSNDMDGSGGVYTSVQTSLVIGDPTGGMSTQTFTYSAPSA